MSMFKKATKSQSKLRLAIVGVSGSGKTYSALQIAKGLGERIALIDTERGSASKYAGDVASFDVLELETYPPSEYVKAIRAAEKEGYDVLVIDSLSHAWAGKGGALEMVDDAASRQKTKNSFTAWREVTPEHNALVDAILSARMHVIVTMRAKTEYVQENKQVSKIGLAPVQREGMEYEFDVIGDIDLEHKMVIAKSRCAALDKKVFRNPGADVAAELKRWLTDGAPMVEKPVTQPAAEPTTSEQPKPAQLSSKAMMLLSQIETIVTRETCVQTEATAKASWGALNAVEKVEVNSAIKRARERVVQLERDREEARQADEALRAQEAAEQAEKLRATHRDELAGEETTGGASYRAAQEAAQP